LVVSYATVGLGFFVTGFLLVPPVPFGGDSGEASGAVGDAGERSESGSPAASRRREDFSPIHVLPPRSRQMPSISGILRGLAEAKPSDPAYVLEEWQDSLMSHMTPDRLDQDNLDRLKRFPRLADWISNHELAAKQAANRQQ
jgi:hypothetical protein